MSDDQNTETVDKQLADVVFNHLVPPAKLPQHEDLDLSFVGQDIIYRFLNACVYVAEQSDDPESPTDVAIR